MTPRRPLSRLLAAGLLATAAASAAQALPPGASKDLPPPPADGAAPAPRFDRALLAAVANPDRPVADRERDKARHPVESLTFWGLQPGMTVVDLQPGGGYWTAILSPYAAHTAGKYIAGGSERGRAAFTAKFADKKWGPVAYTVFGKDSPPFAPPGSADLVLTSREIHNWMGGGYLDKAMADAFAALKPGGILAVEEHRADGSNVKSDGSQGYVQTVTVLAAAEKAGFRRAGSSEINGNPKDTKDHPFGVWTLPPSRFSTGDGAKVDPGFDHTKYDLIGESDRMTLKFVKPPA